MITININKAAEKVSFTLFLESETRVMGVLTPIDPIEVIADATKTIDGYVSGTTTSKLSYIKKSFTQQELSGVYVGIPVTIRGTTIEAIITKDDDYSVYKFYPNTVDEIEYTDKDGVTTFKFKPPEGLPFSDATVFMLAYWGIIDEPILDSNLFINRGVNNIFESIKRLKTTENIEELQKTGFGFFTIYSKGII